MKDTEEDIYLATSGDEEWCWKSSSSSESGDCSEQKELIGILGKMADRHRSFFAKTVEHLARCLAAMKPTPFEKV